jgi:hypothetical protein
VKPILLDAIFRTDVEIVRLGLKRRRYAAVAINCTKVLWRSPRQCAKLVASIVAIFLRKAKHRFRQEDARKSAIGKTFSNYTVDEVLDRGENADYRVVLNNLAVLDAKLGPGEGYLALRPQRGTLAMHNEGIGSDSLFPSEA